MYVCMYHIYPPPHMTHVSSSSYNTCVYIYACGHMHVSIYVCMYVCGHMCLSLYIYVSVHANVRMYPHVSTIIEYEYILLLLLPHAHACICADTPSTSVPPPPLPRRPLSPSLLLLAEIARAPAVLSLHLKRVVNTMTGIRKDSSRVRFGLEIDISVLSETFSAIDDHEVSASRRGGGGGGGASREVDDAQGKAGRAPGLGGGCRVRYALVAVVEHMYPPPHMTHVSSSSSYDTCLGMHWSL